MEPFLGEVKPLTCNYAPQGWAFCAGQLLPISQNQALFALLSTNYGGNGLSTFGLPNLQGRTPVGIGRTYTTPGETFGVSEVRLTTDQIPLHTHVLAGAADAADSPLAVAHLLGGATGMYHAPDDKKTTLNAQALLGVGKGDPHENMQPFLTLNFCIALQGIYPSRG